MLHRKQVCGVSWEVRDEARTHMVICSKDSTSHCQWTGGAVLLGGISEQDWKAQSPLGRDCSSCGKCRARKEYESMEEAREAWSGRRGRL